MNFDPLVLLQDSSYCGEKLDTDLICLKQKHFDGYYEEMQMCMGLSGVSYADFVYYAFSVLVIVRAKFDKEPFNLLVIVRAKFDKEPFNVLVIVRAKFDKEHFQKLIVKLNSFYKDHRLPQVLKKEK